MTVWMKELADIPFVFLRIKEWFHVAASGNDTHGGRSQQRELQEWYDHAGHPECRHAVGLHHHVSLGALCQGHYFRENVRPVKAGSLTDGTKPFAVDEVNTYPVMRLSVWTEGEVNEV